MFVEVQCPACGDGTIRLDPGMLLQGASFACDACQAAVSVADAGRGALDHGLTEFNKLKQQVDAAQRD